MTAAYLLLFLALSVKDDGTALRSRCSADSDIVAKVPAARPWRLEFSMAARPPLVTGVDGDGRQIDQTDTLSATSIDGLESFDRERKNANWAARCRRLPRRRSGGHERLRRKRRRPADRNRIDAAGSAP